MHQHHTSVPTVRDVIPGAGVNIVLKQDQPTGRTVSGVVRDVLTRGNHPRGIKVRLADGRVGRVQSLALNGQAAAGGLTTDLTGVAQGVGESGGGGLSWGVGEDGSVRPRRGREGRMERDMRDEEVPAPVVRLDAYIKPAKQKKRRGGGAVVDATEQDSSGSAGPQQGGTARCPVCDDFEGDEAAVAHHVAGHFD